MQSKEMLNRASSPNVPYKVGASLREKEKEIYKKYIFVGNFLKAKDKKEKCSNDYRA